jgi:hypothetical protein
VTIDASREASLQMDSSPDSPTTGSTNLISLWQQNMLGIKAERRSTGSSAARPPSASSERQLPVSLFALLQRARPTPPTREAPMRMVVTEPTLWYDGKTLAQGEQFEASLEDAGVLRMLGKAVDAVNGQALSATPAARAAYRTRRLKAGA